MHATSNKQGAQLMPTCSNKRTTVGLVWFPAN